MGSITAGSLNIGSGNFTVSTAGAMTATGATISGAITATSGTFTGNIVANNLNISSATVVGTLNANNIKIDDVTIDTDGSGNLIIKSGGVDTTQLADASVNNDKIDSISATKITADQLDSARINVDTLNVKYFANVSTKIYDHQTTAVAVPLLKYGSAIRGAGGNTEYTGSNASFVPFTITQIRNNASYTATLSAVLGDVNGGRVQYSLDNSNWVNASGGSTNIYWSAGTYSGYTYTYQGQITNMTASQTSVYWRVYFSGSYNHTHMQLHVTMDNTT